tara:strand:+ start:202 stop:348 length:147 start_codon:yes stop_codon:yes gene_type:complete
MNLDIQRKASEKFARRIITVRSTLNEWSLRKMNSFFASLALFVAGIIE